MSDASSARSSVTAPPPTTTFDAPRPADSPAETPGARNGHPEHVERHGAVAASAAPPSRVGLEASPGTATPTAGGTTVAGGPTSSGRPEAQRGAEAEALAEQGVQLCRTARWRMAIEPLRHATELDPQNVTAYYYLGDAYNHVDALAQALEAFETASRLQPDHWRALKGIGIVLDRMRRPQEAAAAYQRAREAQSRTTPRLS